MILLGRLLRRWGRWRVQKIKPHFWIFSTVIKKTRERNQENSSSGSNHVLIVMVKIYSNLVFYQMKWKGHKLMNTDSFFDFWDKSDPYLKFLKIRSDNSFL